MLFFVVSIQVINNYNSRHLIRRIIFRSAYVLKQDSLPPSFRSFLNTHGGKDTVILEGLKSFVSGMPSSDKFKAIEKYYSAMGAAVKLDPQMKTPCTVYSLFILFSYLFDQKKKNSVLKIKTSRTCT